MKSISVFIKEQEDKKAAQLFLSQDLCKEYDQSFDDVCSLVSGIEDINTLKNEGGIMLLIPSALKVEELFQELYDNGISYSFIKDLATKEWFSYLEDLAERNKWKK